MAGFADLADLPEDDRIRIIGETVERTGGLIGFVVDDDGGAKAARYIKKLTERYRVRVVDQLPGPVKGATLIRVTKRADA